MGSCKAHVSFLGLLAVSLLAGSVGCEPISTRHNRQDLEMPFLELDYSPARASVQPARQQFSPKPREKRHFWAVTNARPWRYIVLHHSATRNGSARQFDKLHKQRGWDELGYHFVITNGHGGPDGQIQIGSRWRKQKHGAHCGGTPNNEYNEYGIGVCVVGNFMNHNPTPAQLESTRRLLRYLTKTYNISPRNIIAHKDAPGAKTECCGRVFYRYLNSTLRPKLQSQWAVK